MVKNIYPIYIIINKNIFMYHLLITLIIFITKFIFVTNGNIEAPYPISLQIDDNNVVIVNEDGIFFCDLNLNIKTSYDYEDLENGIRNSYFSIDKIRITKLDGENGGNIFVLILYKVYLFSKDGNLISNINLESQLFSSAYINLIPYKKENNNYYFFITYINYEKTNIFIILYKIQGETYEEIAYNFYKPFYLDYPEIGINNDIFTCQIINSEKLEKNILTCCFQADQNKLIIVQSFDIENNLIEIEEYYSKIPIDNLYFLTSIVSEDKNNMLVCYTRINLYGYCFIYNFDTNKISNNNPYIEKCLNQTGTFKLNYFSKTKEYVLVCLSSNNRFTLIKFDSNLQRMNPDEITINNLEITGKYGINSLSLIYDTSNEQYAIIMDSNDNGEKDLFTSKYLISIDFTKHYASQLGKPEELIEVFEKEHFNIYNGNKYFVYTDYKTIYANSVENKTIIIDFLDENNLFVKDKDNKPINSSLYTYTFQNESLEGIITVNINGIERAIENEEKLPIVSKLIYYPIFGIELKTVNFQFTVYLKNNTIASQTTSYYIVLCKENCSCGFGEYCTNCLTNYAHYLYQTNCKLIDDLKHAFFERNNGIYFDCYKKCKTCSQAGYDDTNMNCLTCYTERGDTQDGTNCYEKYCENLFYRDKDTEMKTCVEGSICPDEYPNLNSETNECVRESITEEESNLETESENNSVVSSEKTKTEEINTNEIKPDETKTDEIKADESKTEEEKTEEIKADESKTEEEKTDEIKKEEIKTDETKTNEMKSNEIKSDDIENTNLIEENISTLDIIEKNETCQKIIDLIKEQNGEVNLDEVNKTYSTLSNIITSGKISYFEEDYTINGKNITYQITTSDNQKNVNYKQNVSVIDLGECEKIIKRNISYEDDPIPLIILKIDIKKEESKTTAVEYEVYNPYTKTKIDLSICSNVSIAIYAPVNLTNRENNLYNDLSEQGYDLFDVNNSFYLDPCTQYTSENGTDVSLIDRKNYYYNENVVLCEDTCQYVKVDTSNEKVSCLCQVKDSVNIDNNQEFSSKKLLEKFYKVDTYANFEVLFCYKLLFSSKGLKNNICFFIILLLFILFLTSMIINLFRALKKIDDLIFKIFQDRFMFYFMQKIIINGRKRRGAKINDNLMKDINKIEKGTPKLGWLQKLKLSKQKMKPKENQNTSEVGESSLVINDNKANLYNLNNNNIEIKSLNTRSTKKNSIISSRTKLKNVILEKKVPNINNIKKDETYIGNDNKEIIQKENNVNNNDINIVNNEMIKQNPPNKKNCDILNENKNAYSPNQPIKKKIKKKRIKKCKKKSLVMENTNSLFSNSLFNLHKKEINKNMPKKEINLINEKNFEEKNENNDEKKNEEQKKSSNNNIKYIDEELNRMDYENAIINDKRDYLQYYWSLLKKKHLIILTFVSNDDYNVFILKFSLFILSLALFFFINTLFFKDETLHNIFSQQGKYNLIYQIPQVLYSTLISFFMSLILKRLSLSQYDLIQIKKELDLPRARKLAAKTKKCLSIKMYSFFSVGLILFIFFWYYLSTFAAVYKNTQLHLIKDTLLSFGISMIYPFIINFLPGIFRFPALKSKKKDKECLYKTGQFVAII